MIGILIAAILIWPNDFTALPLDVRQVKMQTNCFHLPEQRLSLVRILTGSNFDINEVVLSSHQTDPVHNDILDNLHAWTRESRGIQYTLMANRGISRNLMRFFRTICKACGLQKHVGLKYDRNLLEKYVQFMVQLVNLYESHSEYRNLIIDSVLLGHIDFLIFGYGGFDEPDDHNSMKYVCRAFKKIQRYLKREFRRRMEIKENAVKVRFSNRMRRIFSKLGSDNESIMTNGISNLSYRDSNEFFKLARQILNFDKNCWPFDPPFSQNTRKRFLMLSEYVYVLFRESTDNNDKLALLFEVRGFVKSNDTDDHQLTMRPTQNFTSNYNYLEIYTREDFQKCSKLSDLVSQMLCLGVLTSIPS